LFETYRGPAHCRGAGGPAEHHDEAEVKTIIAQGDEAAIFFGW
jgi:hypothetical protein